MEHTIQTTKHNQMLNITHLIQQDVKDSGVSSGIVTIFIPHTTQQLQSMKMRIQM